MIKSPLSANGKIKEKFNQRKLPKIQLVVVALISGVIGAYLVFSSRAAIECTQTVSSVSAAQTAVSSASGGSVICMSAGSYAAITLSGTHSSNVTFQPDPSLNPNGAGKVTFSGINISGTYITLRNFYTTRGLNFSKPAANDVADHNDITNSPGGYGINVSCNGGTQPGCSGFTFTGNRVHDLTSTDGSGGSSCTSYGDDGDAIRLDGWANVNITGNEIYHIQQINGSACQGHTDCLQSYQANVNTNGPFVLNKNYIHDTKCQGPPFLKDGNVQNVTITNNLNVRGAGTAIFLVENTTGAIIRNNVYLGGSTLQSSGSSPTASASVDHNIFGQFNINGYSLSGEGYNMFIDGNQWSFNPSSTDLPQGPYGTKYNPTYKCGSSCGNGTVAGDDYRLATNPNGVGIDWTPAEQVYGPQAGGGVTPPSDTTAPTVSMTAPAASSTVSGSSVAVSATASDDTAVTGVQFKLDGNNLGAEDTSSPYSTTWDTTTATNGTHTLTAVAKDAAGNTKTSASVSVTVGNSGSIIFDDGFETGDFSSEKWYVQALSGRATIMSDGAFEGSKYAHFEVDQGDVEPNTGSSRAEISGPTFNEGQDLYIRDAIRIPDTVSYQGPWQIIQQLHETNWGGSPGIALFLNTSPAFTLGAGDGSPTYWNSSSLLKNRWYDLIYHVKLSQDSSLGYVEVWLDKNPQTLSNGQTRMYGQTIQTAQTYLKEGIYRSGSSTGTSLIDHDNTIVGTSLNAVGGQDISDTILPTVSFTAPYPGSKVSGPVPLSVIATDNVGLTQVEFYVDGQKVGTDTDKPYTANWNSLGAAAGNHTITAKAYDAAGNVATSNVTVQLLTNPLIASGIPRDGNVELGLKDPGTPFGSNSFSRTTLPSNTPLNPNNDAYINNLRDSLGQQSISLNTNMWSTPLYVVPVDQSYVPVSLYCSDGSAANGKPGFVSTVLTGGIPIPSNAHAAAGTDESITIYQPSTNKEWELWRLQKDSNGGWQACWGGRIDNVSQQEGIFPFPYGSSASGLSHLDNIPRIEELQAGHIDHVVNLTLPDLGTNLKILKASVPPANISGATKGFSWPANRSDGKSDDPLAIPEGQRFRLPADLDLNQYNLTPLAKVLAEAIQKYGLVVDDGGGAVGIRLGDPTTYTAAGYANPYVAGPGVNGIGTNGLFAGLQPYQVMKNFPWDKLQALPYDYGKPTITNSDTTAPTVSFTSPTNGSTVSGTVTSTVSASDNVAVTKVDISLDGTLKMTDNTSPYNYSFDSKTLTNASHTLSAKAYDAAGNTTTATITVAVNNPDTTKPNAPTNLHSTASTPTSISLAWTASTDTGSNPTGVVKYNVLRNGVVVAQPTTTSYTDTGLTANTSYSYVVQAVDGANNVSANSTTATIKTPVAPDTTTPTTPTNLQAAAADVDQVNLTWTASTDSGGSGLAGYNVYRGGTKLNSSLVTTTSFGDSTVIADTSYSYKVEAVDGSGNKSAQTAAASVTTPKAKTGDLTGASGTPDGVIDLRDISFVIREYGKSGSSADITGPNGTPDGIVDLRDISYLIKNYGK